LRQFVLERSGDSGSFAAAHARHFSRWAVGVINSDPGYRNTLAPECDNLFGAFDHISHLEVDHEDLIHLLGAGAGMLICSWEVGRVGLATAAVEDVLRRPDLPVEARVGLLDFVWKPLTFLGRADAARQTNGELGQLGAQHGQVRPVITAHVRRCQMASFLLDWDEAAEAGRTAVRMADSADADDLLAYAVGSLAIALQDGGQAQADRYLQLARAVNSEEMRAAACERLGTLAARRDALAEASSWLDQALERQTSVATLGHLLVSRGSIHWQAGRSADARADLQEAVQISSQCEDWQSLRAALWGLGWIAIQCGDLSRASERVSDMEGVVGQPVYGMDGRLLQLRAEVALLRGKIGQVAHELRVFEASERPVVVEAALLHLTQRARLAELRGEDGADLWQQARLEDAKLGPHLPVRTYARGLIPAA